MRPFKIPSKDTREQNARGFATWKIASPWRRALAQIFDQGLVWLPTSFAMSFWFSDKIGTSHWWASLVLLSVYVSFVTQILFLKMYGNTPGKIYVGLKIQSARPNQKITFTQILSRTFCWWAGLFSFGLTWTTILSFPDRRAWHDIVADTIVVHAEKKPDYPKPVEITASTVWTYFIIASVFVLLLTTLLFQFRALRSGSLTISDFGRSPSSTDLEDRSWFLAAGVPLPPALPNSVKTENERQLIEVMDTFRKAKDLSLQKRLDTFKTEFEPKEKIFCRSGYEGSGACQTIQAMAGLLGVENTKAFHPAALPGFKILEKIEAYNNTAEQIETLNREEHRAKDGSVEKAALKMIKAHLLMKSNDFVGAQHLLASAGPTTGLFSSQFEEVKCQVAALTNCKLSEAEDCLQNPYWKAWSNGCQMNTEPKEFTMSSEALGFWWSKANIPAVKFENLISWEKTRDRYDTEGTDPFERSVLSALDLVLSIKSTHPGDLVLKSKNLSSENPLWGWAQNQALAEFGEQWAYLVHPAEKKLIIRYGLIESLKGQLIAGGKKTGSATEASTSGPSEPVERHVPRGQRPRESLE